MDSTNVAIEALANGDNDGHDVEIVLRRVTAGGVNGTVGLKGAMRYHGDKLYVAVADSTESSGEWKSVDLT